ncbi:hypothetical protein CEK25_001254 [Fusarium fujikuroi]|nr:hypothetical protein CEK25_001254 [Fusarium fujikuroi]
MDVAQASREVEHVSELPPLNTAGATSDMSAPGQPSQIRPLETINPSISRSGNTKTGGAHDVALRKRRDIEVDHVSDQLLDPGYAVNVTWSYCHMQAPGQSILVRARKHLQSQPALQEKETPVNVVSEIQDIDLDVKRLFEMRGYAGNTKSVCLGER